MDCDILSGKTICSLNPRRDIFEALAGKSRLNDFPVMAKVNKLTESTEDGLDKVVGYAEILKAYPVSKSTIERAWRGPWKVGEPRLPEPGKLRGRSLWPAGVVNHWGRQHFHHIADFGATSLDAIARSDPADLKPEQLEDLARDLSAQALSKRTGMPVDPANLSLQLTQLLTADEFRVLEIKEHQFRIAFLRYLPPDEAAIVVAFLMPQLRSTLLSSSEPDIRKAVSDAKKLPAHFRIVSDFLRLFELETRLLENGLTVPGGKSVLDHLAGLDAERATIVVAWLFPAMRPFIFVADGSGDDQRIFTDDAELGQRAMAALSDDRWAAWKAS